MSDFKPCDKRQSELRSGQEQQRCLHNEASTHLQIIQPDTCGLCPLRKFQVPKVKCGEKPKLTQALSPEGYPDCIYRHEDGDSYACLATKLPVDKEICKRCNADVNEHTATPLGQLGSYYSAVRGWIAAGRPKRTDLEMKEIFQEHCVKCDKYDPEKKSCIVCGCKVSTDTSALKNKLRMATEHCPLGRF